MTTPLPQGTTLLRLLTNITRNKETEILSRLREYMVEKTGMFEEYLMERTA